jgi:hypothetical protein
VRVSAVISDPIVDKTNGKGYQDCMPWKRKIQSAEAARNNTKAPFFSSAGRIAAVDLWIGLDLAGLGILNTETADLACPSQATSLLPHLLARR